MGKICFGMAYFRRGRKGSTMLFLAVRMGNQLGLTVVTRR